MKAPIFRLSVTVLALLVASCSGHGVNSPLPARQSSPATPQSVSPARIKPAPMAKTAILPSSVMQALTPHGARRPQMALRGPQWTQMTGAATQVLACPDGTQWVLSTQPAGSSDKYIWHYANGQWTNISGLASELACSPSSILYVINAGGGTYEYNNYSQSWTALGGGARRITIARDDSVYVLSNAGSGPDYAIWKNQYGTWTQMPGSGTDLAASPDGGTYNATLGTIEPYGMYVLNHQGQIWYLNTDSTYALLSGTAAAVVPTTNGGVFVLGSPANSGGEPIYYYDLQNSGWTLYGGSGTSLSIYNSTWTNGSNLYTVSGSDGAIWTTPVESVNAAIRTAYQVPNAYSVQTLLSYGGKLWWSDGNVVNFMTTGGAVGTPYTIPNNGGDVQMVVGSDGNLWIAQSTASFCYSSCPDYIVRMMLGSNTGSMNFWALPVASGVSGTHANPNSIAAGADGNLWIAEQNQNANQIVRVSTTGTMTPFPVSTDTGSYPHDFVQSIAAGPDGNLWFIITDSSNGYDEIGKITPSGTISRYHLPNANSFMGYNYYWNGIVAGSDGNMWFTEANGNRIGKITMSGSISEYPLPSGTNPQNIGAGPDGNLWLRCECSSAGAGLVKVTTAGAVSGPFSMQNEQVLTLSAGPDKNLWFGSGGGTLVQVAI